MNYLTFSSFNKRNDQIVQINGFYIYRCWIFQIATSTETWMLFFCKKCPDLRYGYKNNYFNIMVYYKDILESRSSFMQIYQNAKNAKPSLHCSHFSFWGISKKVELAGRLEIFHPNKIWKQFVFPKNLATNLFLVINLTIR